MSDGEYSLLAQRVSSLTSERSSLVSGDIAADGSLIYILAYITLNFFSRASTLSCCILELLGENCYEQHVSWLVQNKCVSFVIEGPESYR